MTTAGGIPGLAPGVSRSIRSRDATAHRALRTLLVGGVLGAAVPLASQVPSPAQAQSALQQAVQQNPGLPDQIRQRLQQSGLTAEQVRARLAASGYPPNLLDAYLGAASSGGALSGGALPAGAMELAAIQALGLPPVDQSVLLVDTGMIRMRGAGGPRGGGARRAGCSGWTCSGARPRSSCRCSPGRCRPTISSARAINWS